MAYFTEFKKQEDIIDQYAAPADALADAVVHLAWYGYGSYEGSSLVIYEKGGKLFEVNGSHCSCHGLEGQWEPEETSWAALAKRDLSHSYYDGEQEANKELARLIQQQGLPQNGNNDAA